MSMPGNLTWTETYKKRYLAEPLEEASAGKSTCISALEGFLNSF